jgi:hypothetical protein
LVYYSTQGRDCDILFFMAKRRVSRYAFGLLSAALIIGVIIYVYYAVYCERCPIFRIYFIKGADISAVDRSLRPDEDPLKKAFSELLAGPRLNEQAKGWITLIPQGTKLLSSKVEKRVAILNFNSNLQEYGGGATHVRGMVAQIVYTATGLQGIEKAWIWVDGKKVVVLGGEGLVLDKPLTCEDTGY